MQEERPRRIPQMSTARGRDGGRTQSGGVKGVIAPAGDPGMAEPDADGDDFQAARRVCALVFLSTYLTCLYSIFHVYHYPFLFYFFRLFTSRVSSAHGFWAGGQL